MVELDGSQMTIWRMHFTCCIPKATDMLSEGVILVIFPLQQWLHKCASVLHILPVLFNITCCLYNFYTGCLECSSFLSIFQD